MQKTIFPPLHLNIPNDVFNGFSRTYTESDGRVTVDGRMTVIPAYGGRLKILRPPYRQIGIRASQWVYPTRGFLHADEISMDPIETPVFLAAGQIAFDIGAAVTLSRGGFAAGSAIRAVRDGTHPLLRGVTYTADDGTAYTVLANFGETDAEAVIGGRAVTVPAGAGEIFW